MVTCFICQKEFTNNLGGQVTIHVQEVHGLTQEDYVVLSEYKGERPKCACGLCDESPVFKRGKFLAYAKFHQRFDEKEKRWIEKYGNPKCEKCGKNVEFVRGKPQKFCNVACSAKGAGVGFNSPLVQQKIRQNLISKHGVTNVSHLPEVRMKISTALKGKSHPHSEASKSLIARASAERWSNDEYRESTSSAIRFAINANDQEIIRRSQAMTANHKDPLFVEKMWKGNRNRLSKLHVRVRNELDLDRYGFISEQRVGKFWADELCPGLKVIIEIYGDHPHAKPTKYAADDVIRLRGQSYLAKDKWAADALRRETLEQDGYRVMIIWESDNLNDTREKLKRLLENPESGKSQILEQ